MVRQRSSWRTARVPVLFALGACASVDPGPDFARTGELVRQSTGQDAVFSPEEPGLSRPEIAQAMAHGLGLQQALRFALLNNRRLQAAFMRIGGARADAVQAGLLSNPSLSLGFLFPSGGGKGKFEASILQSISELWQLGPRERAAEQALEREILEVARSAGVLVADTKEAYFEAAAASEAVAIARESRVLAERSLNAVRAQVAAGAATRVDESLAHVALLSADLGLQEAIRREGDARRALAALLSLEDDIAAVPLDALPEPRLRAPDPEAVVRRALAERLDLRAATAAVEGAQAVLSLEERRSGFGLDAGVAVERPESGSPSFLAGPTATLTLPLFDQNQARVSAAEYRYLELLRSREALQAEVGQDVRAAADRAQRSAQGAAFVRDQLLPQAQHGAQLATTAYDLGETTVVTLLEAQRGVLQARQSSVTTRLGAARAEVQLERAAGAPIERLLAGEGCR